MKKKLLFILCILLALPLIGQEAKIIGTVVNLKKEPVENATLSLLKDAEELLSIPSGEKGKFTFHNLEKGTYKIKATHPDYEESLVECTVAADAKGNVYLQRIVLENETDRKTVPKNTPANKIDILTPLDSLSGNIILGRVKTLLNQPLAAATVKLHNKEGDLIFETETDGKGSYILQKAAVGICSITISHPDYENKKTEVRINEREQQSDTQAHIQSASTIVLENEKERKFVANLPPEVLEKMKSGTMILTDKPSGAKQGGKWQNKPIPPFELKDIKGNTWTDKSLLGKPTVINFWYTGCIPCIKEMPELNKWLDEYPEANYLTCTWNSAEVAQPVIEKTPFLFHNLIDGQDLFDKLAIKLTPTTIVLDKEGKIQLLVIGASEINQQRIINKVKELGQ